jgi:hypothetical protein
VTQGSLNLAAGAEVTVTSSIGLSVSDSELGLYNSSNFASSVSMQDYVQWGSAGHEREVVAVNKGIWTAGTFVSATPPLEYTGNGAQNGAQFWDSVLGIGEFDNGKNFKIVQNPAEDMLELEFSPNVENVQIKLFSILGQLVLTKNSNTESTMSIDVSGLSKGMYLVTLKSNNATQTTRFIKN